MPPTLSDDENYSSAEDSDFAPEDAPQPDSTASEDESEDELAASPKPASKKRKGRDGDDAEDAGFENSGDEAIISKGKKRQKKGKDKDKDGDADNEDDGRDGSQIRTRSMRAAEKAERKVAAATGPVTVDVDVLWAQMMSEPTRNGKSSQEASRTKDTTLTEASGSKPIPAADDESMVRIRRTYNFAGKVHTEEKLVPRDSAEAKLFLASQAESPDADSSPKQLPRKAFRSVFEPVLEPFSQRSDLSLNMAVRMRAREEKARKLNTVEKSRMDWAGFVDKEGIKDELALAGKAKGSYAAREAFLARTEARRDDDARRARLTGRA